MKAKICGSCGVEKSADEYHKNRAKRDGLQNWCIDCRKTDRKAYQVSHRDAIAARHRAYYANHKEVIAARTKVYQAANREHIADYQKAYRDNHKEDTADYRRSTPGKIALKAARKRFTAKYPEKKAAKDAVHYAVKTGKLKRSIFCESCGLPAKTEGHHEDYNKPLSVNWLCNDCHTRIHIR